MEFVRNPRWAGRCQLRHRADLFNPENVESSPIGRALPAQASLHNRPIGEVVYELTGRTREDLLDGFASAAEAARGRVRRYDVHLVAAAVARDADVICSANRTHLPEGPLAGDLQVIGPGRLAANLGIT
jgi:hypothetical protein